MIAGFQSSNHPQQTAKRGAVDEVDDRGTRPETFDPLYERFRFTLDVAAAPHNAKCKRYYTREQNGLERPWSGSVWCNPPYSDLGAWVMKAQSEWLEAGWGVWRPPGTQTARFISNIVMLVPANRTEQAWWQDLIEPFRDRDNGAKWMRVEFLRGRPRFDRPAATIGPKGDRPPFGCAVLIWGEG